MVFNTTFNNISDTKMYIMAVSLIGGGNRSILRKPLTCMSDVMDQLYHIMLYLVDLAMSGIRTHNLSTDYTGSCKSNYHTITTAPTGNKI